MPIKQLRENFRFHFAFLQLFIALFVARIILAIRIHCRHEHDVLPVRRPHPAVRAGRNRRNLMRFSNQLPAFGLEIAHPDLRRISRLRCPDQPFAVRRKPRTLLVIRRWIQPARLAPAGRHDPQMRNLRVRLEIDIDAIEYDPFAIRRRHRRADAFERHHVLECERTFLGSLRESGGGKSETSYEKGLHERQSSRRSLGRATCVWGSTRRWRVVAGSLPATCGRRFFASCTRHLGKLPR